MYVCLSLKKKKKRVSLLLFSIERFLLPNFIRKNMLSRVKIEHKPIFGDSSSIRVPEIFDFKGKVQSSCGLVRVN